MGTNVLVDALLLMRQGESANYEGSGADETS
jgi:hypothetical protein